MSFLKKPTASAATMASLVSASRHRIASSLPRTTTRAKSSAVASPALSRYGLGGQHWRQFNPESYQELIHQALSKNVSYFEVAGQEGGDIAMAGAIQSALERNPGFSSSPITITARLGYRSLSDGPAAGPGEGEGKVDAAAAPGDNQPMPGDVLLAPPPEDGTKGNAGVAAAYDTPQNVVHNLSSEYVLQAVRSSPLLELQETMENVRLVFLLHNPEVQVVELLQEDPNATAEARQEFIRQRWTPAMETLQEYSSNGTGVSFGVCSNGLGIPDVDNHPMHLGTNSIVQAANAYDRFSTVQLPANLLETYGWEMARKIKAETQQQRESFGAVDVVAMRPLTCYPDLGTGSGYPFRLVDYALPAFQENDSVAGDGGNPSLCYTNDMEGIPALYQMTLQAAMSHFDAEELLEKKQERDLSMEERETLDGCKLMQSMIHDLDNQLADIRSFAAHEDELYGRIIPLIHDTFELMDDTTSDVLQAYFAAYAVAVRYAIATKTREVLKGGEETGNKASGGTGNITYPDIPQTMTLQEYALRHMLVERCFDRIAIGASTMQDFDHATQLMETIDSGEEHPLGKLLSVTDGQPENETNDGGKSNH